MHWGVTQAGIFRNVAALIADVSFTFKEVEEVKTESTFVKPEEVLALVPENWVTLEFYLMNWNFMDTSMRVKTDTHLFTIKHNLVKRHGRIKDLVICKGSFTSANELSDDMKTLEDYGVTGAPDDPDKKLHKTMKLYYEFKPCDHDDPLLLVWK